MGILVLMSKLIYKKADTYTGMAFSLIIILLNNPYSVFDIGFQLSYLATLGIIFFNSIIFKFLYNNKHSKFKYFKEIISLSISSQIFIIPIFAYIFNKISINFIISNILATPIFVVTILLGILTLILGFCFDFIGKILSIPLNWALQLLIFISEIIGKSEWGNLTVIRPNFMICLFYYIFFLLLKKYHNIVSKNEIWEFLNSFEKKEIIFIKKLENKKEQITKLIFVLCLFLVIISSIYIFSPKSLEIDFIDVGQGDCTFIKTYKNKTILVDGGGNMDGNFDVGKNTVVPYLLAKGTMKIDYLIISHFDTDHVGGLFEVLRKIKVKNIIIGTQPEWSKNYQDFIELAKMKQIKVITVERGNTLDIDSHTKIIVLFPTKIKISENAINNNCLVFKLTYKKFSIFFTGDIESIAEKSIIKNDDNLKSTVLKVAHHGSKSSSTDKFIALVQPKIALIGVGKNNLFGHPNKEVIDRLEKNKAKIYRTDKNGEIKIKTNGYKFSIEPKIK